MKHLKKLWDFLKFQSYLGSSMPSRDLPSNQNFKNDIVDGDIGLDPKIYSKSNQNGENMKKQSNIEVNGKQVSKKEALDLINNDETVISKASVTLENHNKNKSEPLSYEGFEIDKQFVGLSAKKKDKMNASIMATSFIKSPKINNNTFAMVILSPKKDLTEEEINACKVLGIKIE